MYIKIQELLLLLISSMISCFTDFIFMHKKGSMNNSSRWFVIETRTERFVVIGTRQSLKIAFYVCKASGICQKLTVDLLRRNICFIMAAGRYLSELHRYRL